MKPKLLWIDDTGDGLYFKATVSDCALFAFPYEWVVYRGNHRLSGPLGTREDKLGSMCAAEGAARELLKDQKVEMDLLFSGVSP